MLGGATRILIIDDDPRTGPPALQDGGPAEAGASSWPAEIQSASGENARPVMHEYQIPTPLPGDVGAARETVVELSESAHPDTSTVRELIARVEELLHRTRSLPA